MRATMAEAVRVLPVTVTCERCRRTYGYELVRRAVGHATGEGSRAVDRARWVAGRRADRLLARGVDLVPCPVCGWFQADMVREDRRRAGRRVLVLAWVLPAAAVGLAALIWLRTWDGLVKHLTFDHIPEPVRQQVYALVAVAVASAVVVPVGRRAWARPRNLNGAGASPYRRLGPVAAAVPGSDVVAAESPDGWVTVQLAGLTCPPVCARCLTATDRVRPYKVAPFAALSPSVPVAVCAACDGASVAVRAARAILFAIFMAGSVIAIALKLHLPVVDRMLDHHEWAIVPGLVMLGGAAVGLTALAQAGRPFRTRRFAAARNTVEVRFDNPAYIDPFVDHLRGR